MEQGAKQRVFYLDVGCEEGELQRPSELHARGDHAGEHELGPGGDGAPRLARPVGVPVRVLGRPLPSARAAVEADELHLGVAEVAVGHVDGRGPAAAPGAGVHGGRQICGQGVGLCVARGEICWSATRQWSEESEQGKGLSPSDQSPDGQGRKEPRSKKMRRARELEGAPTPGPVDCPALPGPAALTACQAPLGSWLMLIDNSATPSLCAFAQPNDVYKCILLSAQIQLHSQFHFNMPPTTTTITCQLNFKGTRRKAK